MHFSVQHTIIKFITTLSITLNLKMRKTRFINITGRKIKGLFDNISLRLIFSSYDINKTIYVFSWTNSIVRLKLNFNFKRI